METLEAELQNKTAAGQLQWHLHRTWYSCTSLEADLDARTSEVESLEAARDNLTCGEVKSSYNASGCCRSAGGQPENRFTFVDGR